MRVLHFILLFMESTILCGLVGWLFFDNGISEQPEFIEGETELRFMIAKGQEELLRQLDSFTVFYATKDNPKQWTDPKLRFNQKLDEGIIGKVYTHRLLPGVKQFRLEFNPKKGCEVGRQWPIISALWLGKRLVRDEEIHKYFYEPGQKASYDVFLKDNTKGGALWWVIAVAAVLDILILLALFKILAVSKAESCL